MPLPVTSLLCRA